MHPKSSDLEGEIRGLLDSYRETVANTVIKQLKAVKVGVSKRTGASLLLNATIDSIWLVAVPELKERAAEEAVEIISDEEATIRQPQAAH